MDPVTQGLFGAVWAQAGARRETMRVAAGAGILAGMAPDLDGLIRSSGDTLLHIEYHRHFTHSLAFIPAGALIVALLLWPLFKRWSRFGPLYLWCFLGYASHGLLDAFTSYGTHLLWPFSDTRMAWNFISVVDPLFTLPVAMFLGIALWQRRYSTALLSVLWAAAYLGAGGFQQHRAEQVLSHWARDRGIAVERQVAKPSLGNLVLWRGLVDDGRDFHAIAIRIVPGSRPLVYPGPRVERFRSAAVPPDSRLGHDLARFEQFSSGWLFRYHSYEDANTRFVGDFRYAIDPASMRPLWGIRFDPAEPGERARYEHPSEVTGADRRRFFDRLMGRETDY